MFHIHSYHGIDICAIYVRIKYMVKPKIGQQNPRITCRIEEAKKDGRNGGFVRNEIKRNAAHVNCFIKFV